MPSITIWNRLEPRCRTQDLTTGLEARVHDPLWLLARQWQVGEFVGCDGGSPINAQVQWTTSSFDRYACGTGPTHRYDGTQPIEVLVERETVRPTTAAADIQQTAEAGLHFLRLLDAANLGRLRPAYLKQYPLAVPSDSDTDSLRLGSIVLGRVINGVQLYADLVTSLGQPNPALTLDAADSAAVLPITKTWMTWFQALFSEPIETVPWSPERMEYGFMLGAAADSAALVAQEYDGGEVDWYTFDRSFSSTLTSSSAQSTSTTRTIPVTPVTFVGMPARRFWEMEDAAVDIGALTAGAQDLGRLLLREFALIYGNDWFQFPLVLPAGCQASITSLVVSDTFGVTTTVPHYASADGATSSWRIFAMGPDGLPNTPNLLVVPPNGVGLLNSASVEDVLLLRDELAEMAWGVEHSAVGPSGTTIDRVLHGRPDSRRFLRQRRTIRLLTAWVRPYLTTGSRFFPSPSTTALCR